MMHPLFHLMNYLAKLKRLIKLLHHFLCPVLSAFVTIKGFRLERMGGGGVCLVLCCTVIITFKLLFNYIDFGQNGIMTHLICFAESFEHHLLV